MKKVCILVIILCIIVASVVAFKDYIPSIDDFATVTATPTVTAKPTPTSNSSSYSKNNSTVFTNKYGTATTLCAHSGCTRYIASSGDTNCCITHSQKCLNCKKYIDEDAMYCMNCLSGSISSKPSNSSSGSSYSGGSYTSSANTCQYKQGGNYVCSSPATNGSFCKKHWDYLYSAYNSLVGGN